MHFCSVELSRYDGLSRDELAENNGALLQRWTAVDPVEVMHKAWERCVRTARREGILGSSTALLAVLRGDELRVANLGDCVLLIVRDGDLLFRSTEQQHSFNFPVQLGMMGDTVEIVKERVKAAAAAAAAAAASGGDAAKADAATSASAAEMEADESDLDDVEAEDKGGEAATTTAAATAAGPSQASQSVLADDDEAEWDEPRRDAGRWTVKVEPGDIIILGSDGLVDNLFDEDILEEVLRFVPNHGANLLPPSDPSDPEAPPQRKAVGSVIPPDFSPQDVSEALCSRAKAVSEDSRAISSPFQQRAMEEGLVSGMRVRSLDCSQRWVLIRCVPLTALRRRQARRHLGPGRRCGRAGGWLGSGYHPGGRARLMTLVSSDHHAAHARMHTFLMIACQRSPDCLARGRTDTGPALLYFT